MNANPTVMAQFPRDPETGKRVSKPLWWYAMIAESELHSRIITLAEKRAKELACFGGK